MEAAAADEAHPDADAAGGAIAMAEFDGGGFGEVVETGAEVSFVVGGVFDYPLAAHHTEVGLVIVDFEAAEALVPVGTADAAEDHFFEDGFGGGEELERSLDIAGAEAAAVSVGDAGEILEF